MVKSSCRWVIINNVIYRKIKLQQTIHIQKTINNIQLILLKYFFIITHNIDMRIDSQYGPLIMRLLAYNQQSVFDAL